LEYFTRAFRVRTVDWVYPYLPPSFIWLSKNWIPRSIYAENKEVPWSNQLIMHNDVVSISKELPLELVMDELAPSTAPDVLF
jgi:hypothetical protein